MKIVIINLSPRNKGTSTTVSRYIKEHLEKAGSAVNVVNYFQNKDENELLELIKQSDSIVVIGPCYVDTYPADMIYLLEKLAKQKDVLHGQSLYGFIQGGMPYVHTHECGLRLLDNFADENAVNWMGGFVMGGGAMLDGKPLEQSVNAKSIIPAIQQFIINISKNEKSPDSLYKDASMKTPYLLTLVLVRYLNYMVKRDLKKKGIDYKVPSPYLNM